MPKCKLICAHNAVLYMVCVFHIPTIQNILLLTPLFIYVGIRCEFLYMRIRKKSKTKIPHTKYSISDILTLKYRWKGSLYM